ncbi:MAG TPA: DUF2285 domain-containing protein [Sphingomonas sp.]
MILHYAMHGLASAEPKLLPLRRLIDLARYGRFLAALYPPDRRIERWIAALRIFDAVAAGASQREIALSLYAGDADPVDDRLADSRRSRVRRLVREARALARGGYRSLMTRQVK